MRVLFFAQARLATGIHEEVLSETAPCSSDEFWNRLLVRHPDLTELRAACRLARNGKFLATGEKLQPEDEVAVLPPVSGG